jgi:hypothetical protein
MDTILDMQNFHKQEPDVSWNEALDAEDAFRRDAIEYSKILSSPTGRPSQLS